MTSCPSCDPGQWTLRLFAAMDLDLQLGRLGRGSRRMICGNHNRADAPNPASCRPVLPVADARQKRRCERHEPQY
jgi:hypothetical protein